MRVIILAAGLLFAASPVRAELESLGVLNETFTVRQGATALSTHPSPQACETEAQRRTTNAGAATKTYQVRSGGGTLVASPASVEECTSLARQRLQDNGARTSGSDIASCQTTTKYSTAFQPPVCLAVTNYVARYREATSEPPPSCPPLPAPRAGECPSGTYGAWLSTPSAGPAPGCELTWSPAPAGTCRPNPVCDCPEPEPVTCPTPPPPQTRAGTCPSGTTGSWTQTGTTTFSAPPACTPTVTWSPPSPPTGACTTPPTGGGPTLTATAQGTTVTLNWTGSSAAYSYERCRGADCTNFAPLGCTQSRRITDILPAQATARYRVRGSAQLNCSSGFTGYGNAVQITVGGTSLPGRAVLNWTPPTRNVDGTEVSGLAGYYVVYGRTEDTMNTQIIVPGGATRMHIIDNLASGTWYFTVKAFTTNYAQSSNPSNVISKVVQ